MWYDTEIDLRKNMALGSKRDLSQEIESGKCPDYGAENQDSNKVRNLLISYKLIKKNYSPSSWIVEYALRNISLSRSSYVNNVWSPTSTPSHVFNAVVPN
jgi:hypothetical protein